MANTNLSLKKQTIISKDATNKGVILMTALVITMILAVVASTILALGLWSYQQATFYEDYNQALYSAEAGINHAVATDLPGGSTLSVSSTGHLFNASYFVTATTLAGGTTNYVSTATVRRLTNRVRTVSVNALNDNPWKHFIWQGCGNEPAGNYVDKIGYPVPYNKTTNGPKFDANSIGILTYYNPPWPNGGKKWQPYWSKITSKAVPNAIYIGRDTTIVNWTPIAGGVTYQFSTIGNVMPVSISGFNISTVDSSTYRISGHYTGLLYVQGSIEMYDDMSVYGQLYAVGGNISIKNKSTLTVMQVTTRSPASLTVAPQDNEGDSFQKYVTIACIDTTASYLCSDSTFSNPNAGSIKELGGNCELHMGSLTPNYPAGVLFISNYQLKNGQGTIINGVIMLMNNNINGFASGDYYYDPSVNTDAPILGLDISHISTIGVVNKTWRELPSDWSL